MLIKKHTSKHTYRRIFIFLIPSMFGKQRECNFTKLYHLILMIWIYPIFKTPRSLYISNKKQKLKCVPFLVVNFPYTITLFNFKPYVNNLKQTYIHISHTDYFCVHRTKLHLFQNRYFAVLLQNFTFSLFPFFWVILVSLDVLLIFCF